MKVSIDSTGFTLLEILVALVILSVSLLALAGLMTMTTRNNSYGSHITEAATFAQDKLEELRAVPWGNVNTGGDQRAGATGVNYIRNWNVVANSDDSLRTITIRVDWNDRTDHSIRLVSVISK